MRLTSTALPSSETFRANRDAHLALLDTVAGEAGCWRRSGTRGSSGPGGCGRRKDQAAFKAPAVEMFDRQSHPLYASARLWDDGIVDPRKARAVLALSLTAALHAAVGETRFGVFGM